MTKPFADFKEDLRLFCSENKVDNDKISIVGVSKKKSLEDILGPVSYTHLTLPTTPYV